MRVMWLCGCMDIRMIRLIIGFTVPESCVIRGGTCRITCLRGFGRIWLCRSDRGERNLELANMEKLAGALTVKVGELLM